MQDKRIQRIANYSYRWDVIALHLWTGRNAMHVIDLSLNDPRAIAAQPQTNLLFCFFTQNSNAIRWAAHLFGGFHCMFTGDSTAQAYAAHFDTIPSPP